MKRGELYRVFKATRTDPRRSRAFVIVSRQALIDSAFSTVICAPIYSRRHGLSTQVEVGIEEGLKTESCIHCDELVSLPKASLTNFIGSVPRDKLGRLEEALQIALDLRSRPQGGELL